MQLALRIFNILRNKYVAALMSFIILILFIDHNDLFVQMDRQRQLNDLITSKRFYQQQIEQTKKNLADLQNNPAALERYAREKFYLKRDNEDLFIVTDASNQKNSQNKQ